MGTKLRWISWGSALALGCTAPLSPFEVPDELILLHTSDVHSHLWPFRDRITSVDSGLGLGREGDLAEVGGAARLATLAAEERRRGASLWLDSGDLLEGTPVFGRYGGAVEVALWERLGVSAMALGNHELSLTASELERLFGATRFPLVAANLAAPGGVGWLSPYAIVRAGAVPLGVIGCATPGSPPSLDSAGNPWGLLPTATAAAVQEAADALAGRTALVVVVSHLGLDADRELVRATSGLDLVLGGHQHTQTPEPEWEEDCSSRALQRARGCAPRRVPIVHSGAYGRYLSRVRLRLQAAPSGLPGALAIAGVSVQHLPVTAEVPEDPATAAWLEPHRPPPEPPLAYLPEAIRRSSPVGGDSPLGDLVADAIRAETGADAVILNASGLRDDLEAGPLLGVDLALAFPFEEPWRLALLGARELRAGFERAARKSASRGCETALELAGLWWRVRCAACSEKRTRCWQAGRGESELDDAERLLVALPEYLTLPGADFEEARRLGDERELSVTGALRRHFASFRSTEDTDDCARALERLSPARCAEGFGAACPVSGERARAICRALPVVEGGPSGRVLVR